MATKSNHFMEKQPLTFEIREETDPSASIGKTASYIFLQVFITKLPLVK
jgi:hypothetical protein